MSDRPEGWSVLYGIWLPTKNPGWLVNADGVVIAFVNYRVAQAQLHHYRLFTFGIAVDVARVMEIGLSGEPVEPMLPDQPVA